MRNTGVAAILILFSVVFFLSAGNAPAPVIRVFETADA